MTSEPVRVASIGGGPGSDILGILRFARENDLLNRQFRFKVLDREPKWNRVRKLLCGTYEDADVVQHGQAFDAAVDGEWTDDWGFTQADIFTLSFFLSEVWSFNDDGAVSNFIQRFVDEARPGALFVYVDNGGAQFSPLVEAEFAREDIELVNEADHARLLISFDEQCDVLQKYREEFAQMPKLKGEVSWRLWRKLDG